MSARHQMAGRNEQVDMAALNASRVDGAGQRPPRVTLFCRLLENAVAGRPAVRDMGWRMWLMLERLVPGSVWRLDAAGRVEVLRVGRDSAGALDLAAITDEASPEDVARVAGLIVAGEHCPERLGRRVMLLAYAFCRGSAAVTAALPNFETMGWLLGLRATNKRSAVSAAMNTLVRRIVESGELRQTDHARTEFWFSKKRSTREACARAQKGNTNRRDGMERREAHEGADEEDGEGSRVVAEVAQVVEGVPLREEWRGLSARQLRARLDALHEAAERRRLGV